MKKTPRLLNTGRGGNAVHTCIVAYCLTEERVA